MLDRVRAIVERHRMFSPETRVGVAVSGGIDSVVLLDVLHRMTPNLCVVHLNHRLRGDASDEDERFVAQLAAGRNLPFHASAVDLPAGNIEQQARDARRDFFRQLRSGGAAERIATGHTRSDQAETVLYRLLRGSGTAGLSGILPVTDEGLIRPLLECSRADIEVWARDHGLAWREDHTNSDSTYIRNRIRRHLLPYLTGDFNAAIPEILATTANLARDEEDYWRLLIREQARKHFTRGGDAILLRTEVLSQAHPAVARRLIRQAIVEVKGDLRGIDLPHIEAVMDLTRSTEGHGRMQAPGIDVFRSFEWLKIVPPRATPRWALDYSFAVTGQAKHRLPGSHSAIFLEIRPETDREPYNVEVDDLDWDRLRQPVELRNWYPGDEFQPPGRARRKIKVLFQEARVPIWERHLWPVLTAAGEIAWTRGFGVAEGFAPGAGTRTVLRVYEMEGDSPSGAGTHRRSGESDEAA